MKFKFLAILLIFSFGFLLSPKDLWHSCDEIHHSHQEERNHDEFSNFESSCSICDFDLFQLDYENFTQLFFEKSEGSVTSSHFTSLDLIPSSRSLYRGPPVIS
jgi:hypothetical protein